MTSWASSTEGPNETARPGMKLGGRYELRRPIASGGMAQVWAATDVQLDRVVAIKVLHPHLGTDDAFVERFRREAVAAARLSHDSIVAVFDTISDNGLEAIVMELIDGKTLREMLDDVGALPAVDVIHLGARIASALDEAHRAGIVHRDIKPANIMVSTDRRITVTDFGIAKAGSDADLTQTGTLLGTAKYLAPEQVTGDPIDPRSDLYSLGVVLFEALTGTVPFKANTDAATALARLHQSPPSIQSLRPNVSGDLAAVVSKLISRDPGARFQRASELHDALLRLDPAVAGDDGGPVALNPAVTGDASANALAAAAASTQVHETASAGAPAVPVSDGGPPIDFAPPVGPPRSRRETPPAVSDPGRARPPDPPPSLTQGPPLHGAGVTGHLPPEVLGQTSGQVPAAPTGRRKRRSKGSVPAAQPEPEFQVLGVEPAGSASSTLSDGRIVRSGRSRAIPLVVIGLVVAGLVVAAVLLTDVETMMGLGGGEDVPTNPIDENGAGLAIAGARSFDPLTSDADQLERESITSLAIDGDPSTAWTTETYRRRELGGLKQGVGLLVSMEERLPLNRVEIASNSEGWVAEIYVADEFGVDPSTWGTPVATVENGSGTEVRDLGATEGSIVLLWLRDTGVSGERIRFELAEIVIR